MLSMLCNNMLRIVFEYAYTTEGAIKDGNMLAVQILTLNQQKNSKFMMWAAEYGQLEICKWLDKNRYKTHDSAVHVASKCGHKEVVKYLVEVGNIFNTDAIDTAIKNKYWKIAKFLVKHAWFKIPSDVMHDFYEAKQYKAVEILIKKGNQPYYGMENDVVTDNKLTIAKLLLKHTKIMHSCLSSSYNEAAKYGFTNMIIILLNANIEIHFDNSINKAAKYGHIQLVEILLQAGKTCTEKAIYEAAARGHTKIVEILLKAEKPYSFLTIDIAASKGHTQIVKTLLEAGKNCSYLALDKAAENGHLDIVKLLCDCNVSFTPDALEKAAYNNHNAIFDLLFNICKTRDDNSSEIMALNRTNKTDFIEYFAQHNYIEIVKKLLIKGYQLTENALELASANGHELMVRFIINSGVRCTWKAIENALELKETHYMVKYLISIMKNQQK